MSGRTYALFSEQQKQRSINGVKIKEKVEGNRGTERSVPQLVTEIQAMNPNLFQEDEYMPGRVTHMAVQGTGGAV